MLIVIAAIGAYLFTPVHDRLKTKLSGGLATTLTVLAALLIVVIPIIGVGYPLPPFRSAHAHRGGGLAKTADLNALGDKAMAAVNNLLQKLPFQTPTITLESLRENVGKIAQTVGEWLLRTLSGAAGGAIGFITSAIIFLYVLISLLGNKTKVITLIRRLNPLGDEVTDLTWRRWAPEGNGQGQFIIAVIQGTPARARSGSPASTTFFIFAIFLTALSVIPLGSGIVTIPFGIGLMLSATSPAACSSCCSTSSASPTSTNFLRPTWCPKRSDWTRR